MPKFRLNGVDVEVSDLSVLFNPEETEIVKLTWKDQVIFEKGVKEEDYTLELYEPNSDIIQEMIRDGVFKLKENSNE